jgi:hypothetical protein
VERRKRRVEEWWEEEEKTEGKKGVPVWNFFLRLCDWVLGRVPRENTYLGISWRF